MPHSSWAQYGDQRAEATVLNVQHTLGAADVDERSRPKVQPPTHTNGPALRLNPDSQRNRPVLELNEGVELGGEAHTHCRNAEGS